MPFSTQSTGGESPQHESLQSQSSPLKTSKKRPSQTGLLSLLISSSSLNGCEDENVYPKKKTMKFNNNSPTPSPVMLKSNQQEETKQMKNSDVVALLDLPSAVCVNVFNYLDPESFLIAATLVSKKCWYEEGYVRRCSENNYPGIAGHNRIVASIELSPKEEHQETVNGVHVATGQGGSTRSFFQNLSMHQRDPIKNNKLRNGYRRFRVNDVQKFDESVRNVDLQNMINGSSSTNQLHPLDSITSLDLSLPSPLPGDEEPSSNSSSNNASFHSQHSSINNKIGRKQCGSSLPLGLSRILPNLKEIDMSNGDFVGSVLRNFTEHCPKLETIVWKNISHRTYIDLDGYNMRYGSNLKELVLDGSYFSPIKHDEMSDLHNYPNTYLFHEIVNSKLERVSIKNAKFRNCELTNVPQTALMKFVLNGPPTLKYFSSDLTPENIELLSQIRPDVQFD